MVWLLPVTLFGVPLMSPLPLADRFVILVVLSRVHAKVVPVKLLLVLNAMVVIATSEHTVCEAGVATPTGSGLTVIVTVNGSPVHEASLTGTIVYMTLTGAPVVFVQASLLISALVKLVPVTGLPALAVKPFALIEVILYPLIGTLFVALLSVTPFTTSEHIVAV